MTTQSTPLTEAYICFTRHSKNGPTHYVEADFARRLELANAELVEALKEILWQCGGRVDINDDGGPNLAMVVDSIAYAAIAAQEKP